jgi:hypothetical protein
MKYIPLILLLILNGCSILSILGSKPKPNPIPTMPVPTYEQMENRKQNGKIIQDIAHHADEKGLIAKSTASGVLRDCADILVMLDGLPAEDINWQIKSEVKDLHEKIRDNESEYRKSMDEWLRKIDELSRDKDLLQSEIKKKDGMIDRLIWWLWVVGISLGLITFFFPTIGVAIIKWLVGKTKKSAEVTINEVSKGLKTQFSQICNAIEMFKNDPDTDEKKLIEYLEKETDSSTRNLIKDIKYKNF